MLIELVRRAAVEAPERPAFISPGGTMTYADCLGRCEALARGLRDRGIERFGSAVDDPADVLVALAGSSAAGSEACVYPREIDAATMDDLASRFDHRVVVTDGPEALTTADALPLDELETTKGEPPEPPDSAPVLILTTGTTGNQRGARHEWSRLVAATRHPDRRPGERWLLAYNLTQFGGIQVLLHALTSHATLVTAPSRQPRDVIQTIRDAEVTHVSATPTFWRLLVGSLDPEEAETLPLEQITLGGEAVQGRLIERIQELFPAAHVSQIYGATEFGTAVSVRDGRSGLPASVLERGDDADVQLRIVDGEIQMRSKVGMLGYHDEAPADHGWRATGDLVELRGDRVHFIGRKTEIINVGGAKVHPLPIEEAASAVEGVELAAAYGRANPVTGQIVALDVVAASDADTGELEAAVREACSALPAPSRPRRIRFVPELEIRGHKLARLGSKEAG